MRRSARPLTPGGTGIDSELAPAGPVWLVMALSKRGLEPQPTKTRLVATVAHHASRRDDVRGSWASQPRIEHIGILLLPHPAAARRGVSIPLMPACGLEKPIPTGAPGASGRPKSSPASTTPTSRRSTASRQRGAREQGLAGCRRHPPRRRQRRIDPARDASCSDWLDVFCFRSDLPPSMALMAEIAALVRPLRLAGAVTAICARHAVDTSLRASRTPGRRRSHAIGRRRPDGTPRTPVRCC